MALLYTPPKQDAFLAPSFALKGTDGKIWQFEDVRGKTGTLILFICNHCPYVKSVITRLTDDIRTLQKSGIGVAAIMPNDTDSYPADSFENMKIFAKQHDFTFPYLIDETQETAKTYGAVCTPDIFGFDSQNILQYRGRIDSAGKNEAAPDTRREMRDALLQIAQNGTAPAEQIPSMGCSIKWKDS